MSTLELVTVSAALVAAAASICSPFITTFVEVFFYFSMRMIINRLSPPAQVGGISTNSRLECKFVGDNMV